MLFKHQSKIKIELIVNNFCLFITIQMLFYLYIDTTVSR